MFTVGPISSRVVILDNSVNNNSFLFNSISAVPFCNKLDIYTKFSSVIDISELILTCENNNTNTVKES